MLELQKENTDNQVAEFLKTVPQFKVWIENTSLFHALKNDLGGTIRLHDAETQEVIGEMQRNGIVITKAEDLPVALLYNFYINSPFYSEIQLNLITNDNQD